jgi:hypothetical protein
MATMRTIATTRKAYYLVEMVQFLLFHGISEDPAVFPGGNQCRLT